MDCEQITFTVHATRRLFERRMRPRDVRAVIRSKEPILENPDARPFPKFLILGYIDEQAIHVVVARDAARGAEVAILRYVETWV
jgi:hypothetical protein